MRTLSRLAIGAALTTAVLTVASCSNSGTASSPDLATATQDLSASVDQASGSLFPDIGPLADLKGSMVVRVTGGFAQPFGVIFDATTNAWYVSNIAGDLANFQNLKDGKGWITKISADYQTVDHTFFTTGLNAPAGMRIAGGKLYFPDVDQLVVVDLTARTAVRSATVPPPVAGFPVVMTDVVIDSAGAAYVPETVTARILKFSAPTTAGATYTSYAPSGVSFPTTLYIDGTNLVVGTTGSPQVSGSTGSLYTMKLADGTAVTKLGNLAANFQGIEKDTTNSVYLVGTTRAHTVNHIVPATGASTVLLDSANEGGVSVGDIGWDPTNRILAVPDTGTNSIYFYKQP